MADTVLPRPDRKAFDEFLRAQARALRAKDRPPASRKEWEDRRARLRAAMFAVMGPFPDKPCDLEPKVIGVLKRQGYQFEKLIFQSRSEVWVTASAYVPRGVKGKAPAVLVVHGHWAGARRDVTGSGCSRRRRCRTSRPAPRSRTADSGRAPPG